MELTPAISLPRSKNLVFTSAGDRSNLHRWLSGSRNFDLWVVYYGDRPGTFQDQAEYYICHKGSKFQNLHHCYRKWKDIFKRYEAIMVLDDDILISATGLSRLFGIRQELDLWILQPAFRVVGKISWDITRVRPGAKLRFTNFVELACPLFRRDKLDAFMAVYDPELVGFGTDWWFLKTVGPDLKGHVAVIDEITCINPHDRSKGGIREIDQLQSKIERQAVWDRLKAYHGITVWVQEQQEFGCIRKTAAGAMLGWLAYIPDWVYMHLRRLGGRVVRTFFSPF